ncbi:DUF3817 domain-containing protein [Actinoplanes sp. M2I2]|uniref:DUF3817 domain-containing protein n=1 Tax=Actinoplanes sp. M2I2 TaxID=1734444 RepID=UPI0020214653|nr:DUF3817 domain-containing protein [Actinoplanes sp. M2I2]
MSMLRAAARVELLSLLVLLGNLATVHVPWVATLLGPLHGCAYLVVIGATLAVTGRGRARLLAVVPGIGGLLVLRVLHGRAEPAVRAGDA